MTTKVMNSNQKFAAIVRFKDAAGGPLPPASPPTWSVSNPSMLSVTLDGTDGMSATIRALGPIGVSQVTVTATINAGGGATKPASAIMDVQVLSAVTTEFQTGDPQDM